MSLFAEPLAGPDRLSNAPDRVIGIDKKDAVVCLAWPPHNVGTTRIRRQST